MTLAQPDVGIDVDRRLRQQPAAAPASTPLPPLPPLPEALRRAVDCTAPQLLAWRARKTPRGLALREVQYNGQTVDWSWRNLNDAVCDFVAALLHHGMRPGERVAILCEPDARAIVAFLGAQAAGCLPCGIHASDGAAAWREILADVQPAVLISDRPEGALDFLADADFPPPRLVVDARRGVSAWHDLLDQGAQYRRHNAAECDARMMAGLPDEPGAVYYAAGGTGRPRGVLLSWRGLVLSLCGIFGRGAVEPIPGPADRALHDIAMASHEGLWFGIAYPLVFGCTAYVAAPGTDPLLARRVARPTLLYGHPPMWMETARRVEARIAEHPPAWRALHRLLAAQPRLRLLRLLMHPLLQEQGLGAVRHAFSGGAPIAPAVVLQWQAWGLMIRTFYGMAECSGIATAMAGRVPLPETVGRPSPTARVQLDEDGAILIGGPILFKGYLNQPEATVRAFSADGFFRTGDLGRFDAGGNLLILDRPAAPIDDAYAPPSAADAGLENCRV